MNSIINANEILFRVAKPYAIWIKTDGRFSSSLFKDELGVSVDRDGDRTNEKIILDFISRFGTKDVVGIVSIDADFCYNLPSSLLYKPEPYDVYHSEIHDTDNKVELSRSKAKRLAKNCKIIYNSYIQYN